MIERTNMWWLPEQFGRWSSIIDLYVEAEEEEKARKALGYLIELCSVYLHPACSNKWKPTSKERSILIRVRQACIAILRKMTEGNYDKAKKKARYLRVRCALRFFPLEIESKNEQKLNISDE